VGRAFKVTFPGVTNPNHKANGGFFVYLMEYNSNACVERYQYPGFFNIDTYGIGLTISQPSGIPLVDPVQFYNDVYQGIKLTFSTPLDLPENCAIQVRISGHFVVPGSTYVYLVGAEGVTVPRPTFTYTYLGHLININVWDYGIIAGTSINVMFRMRTSQTQGQLTPTVNIWNDASEIDSYNPDYRATKTIQMALEAGDLENAGYAGLMGIFQLHSIGKELAECEHELTKYSDVMRHLKQERSLSLLQLIQQYFSNLMGQVEDPCRLIGENYDENKPILNAHNIVNTSTPSIVEDNLHMK